MIYREDAYFSYSFLSTSFHRVVGCSTNIITVDEITLKKMHELQTL